MSSAQVLHGVLEVITSAGPIYVAPNFFERLCLAWIFRNFRILPMNVLNGRAQRRIESIVLNRRRAVQRDDIIGTIDCRRPKKDTVVPANRPEPEPVRELVEV